MRVIPRSVGEQGKEKAFLNSKRAPISAVDARLYAGASTCSFESTAGRAWMAGTSPAMTTADGGFVKTIAITLAIIACSVPAHAQTLPSGKQGFVNYSKEWWHFSLPGAGGPAYDFPIAARMR
jgi:energy-converting hydrogenase Eha subunit B